MTDLFSLPPAPRPAKAPPARVVGTGINLRFCQREDADAIQHAIETGHTRPCCVGATGIGKGAIIAETAGRLRRSTGGKVVCLVDRAHLVHQLADEIDRHLGVTCGRVADGQCVGIHHAYVVSTVQAMYTPDSTGKPLFEYPQFESTRAVIGDECHKLFAPVFRSPFEHFMEMHGAVCVGFTATPVAANGAEWQSFFNWTPEAEGPCMRTVGWCIRNGYLVPPRQAFVSVNLDLKPLYERLAETLPGAEQDEEVEDAAAVLLDLLSDKGEQDAARFAAGVADVIGDRRAIVFAPPRVAAAKLLASWLKATGRLSCDAVWGGRVDKSDVLGSFKRGRPQVLTNVNILCEGFDSPTCSAVFICRLMKQWRLVAQMVGRCLRPHPSVIQALNDHDEPDQADERRAAIAASEKPNALIADLVGIDGKVIQASALDVLYATESQDVRREAGDIILNRKGTPQADAPSDEVLEAARSQLLQRQHEQLKEQARRRGMAGEISADVSVTYDDGHAVRLPKTPAARQPATIGEKAMFVAVAMQYDVERAMDMAERFPRNQLKGMTFGMKRKLDAANRKPDWSRARKAYPEWAKQKAGAW